MKNYTVIITCVGVPPFKYVFENVTAQDKIQAKEWARHQPLPQHEIKEIIVTENTQKNENPAREQL